MSVLSAGGGEFAIAAALLALLLVAVAAGTLGSLLGLGGGLLMVPALVVLFGVEIHLAIAASLVSVIATSSGSASTHIEEGLTDLRIGMFLEVATVVGAVVGAAVTIVVLANQDPFLILAFVPIVLASAALMFRTRHADIRPDPPPDPIADRFALHGEYRDDRTRERVGYRVTGTRAGLTFAALGGFVSGFLGIGGGIFNVPGMNAFMNVPLRVAGATSNFMIGVTAAAGAILYLLAGEVVLVVAAPVVIGMLIGSQVGTRLSREASPGLLKLVFTGLLVAAAAFMVLRGAGALG